MAVFQAPISGDAMELVERAIRAREVTAEGRRDDEAHQIRERAPGREQLAEVLGAAAGLWREFDNQDKAEAVARLAEEFRIVRDGDREREHRERAEAEERERHEAEERERSEAEQRERQEAERHERELAERRRELEEHAHRIERELEGLGDSEEAQRLRHKLEELGAEIREIDENLRAAGLHEQAEHLAREMEQFVQGPPRHLSTRIASPAKQSFWYSVQ